MILGCGSQRLCRFSSDDLYVPIKLDFDKDNKAPNSSSSSTVISSDAADVSLSADGEISASRASQSSLDASGNDLESSTAAKYSSSNNERQIAQAVKQIFNLDERAQYVKMVEDKKYKYLIYAIPSDDGKSQEISAVVTHELYKTIQATNQSSINELSYRVHKLGSEQHSCVRHQSLADMIRHAKDFLSDEDSLNHEARRTAQEDINFYSSDVYQEDTDTIVIDSIFCETSHGVLNRIDRFEKLRSVAYESEDGRACIHYRISASEQSDSTAQERDSKSYIPKTRFITKHELLDGKGNTIEKAKDAIFDLITLNPLLRMRDRRMFNSTKESIDDPFCSCQEQGAEYDDVIVPGYDPSELNQSSNSSEHTSDPASSQTRDALESSITSTRAPQEASLTQVQAIRDSNGQAPKDSSNHGFMNNHEEGLVAASASVKGQACLDELKDEISSKERQTISELFSSIEEEGGLTSNEVNEALTVLNTIASKYLTNYQSSTHIYNKTVHNHPRTAREIVSHPVSVASLSSLKNAIADSKPSSTKFLLSIIAGALLMSKGEREFDEYARPILILEDIESRFHPTLLLNFWSILQVLPIPEDRNYQLVTADFGYITAQPTSSV